MTTPILPLPPDEVYAVPGENSIIDMIHPVTGLTVYGGRDAASVQEKYPGAVRMPYEMWRAQAIARQDTPIIWQTTDAKSYERMLNVLPPALWIGGAFLVGEPCDHSYATSAPRFQGFWHRNGQYFASDRPITRAELRAALAPQSAHLAALIADAAEAVETIDADELEAFAKAIDDAPKVAEAPFTLSGGTVPRQDGTQADLFKGKP